MTQKQSKYYHIRIFKKNVYRYLLRSNFFLVSEKWDAFFSQDVIDGFEVTSNDTELDEIVNTSANWYSMETVTGLVQPSSSSYSNTSTSMEGITPDSVPSELSPGTAMENATGLVQPSSSSSKVTKKKGKVGRPRISSLESRINIEKLQLLIRNKSEIVYFKKINKAACVPRRMTIMSAGYDLCSCQEIVINPEIGKNIAVIHTGLVMLLPLNTYGQISDRSSLAVKGLKVAGGVIDADYCNEIKVIMYNLSGIEQRIHVGDRIAQMIISPFSPAESVLVTSSSEFDQLVDSFNIKKRGEGFGSTNGKSAKTKLFYT